jgi:hypothetical protein
MNDPNLKGIPSLIILKLVLMAYADNVILFLSSMGEWLRAKEILLLNSKINYSKTITFHFTYIRTTPPLPTTIPFSLFHPMA